MPKAMGVAAKRIPNFLYSILFVSFEITEIRGMEWYWWSVAGMFVGFRFCNGSILLAWRGLSSGFARVGISFKLFCSTTSGY